MNFTGDDIRLKENPHIYMSPAITKSIITTGIIKIPVKIAKTGLIALYFLNLNASFKSAVAF